MVSCKYRMKVLSKDEIDHVFKDLKLETEEGRKEKLFEFDKKSENRKTVYTISERTTSEIESENANVG